MHTFQSPTSCDQEVLSSTRRVRALMYRVQRGRRRCGAGQGAGRRGGWHRAGRVAQWCGAERGVQGSRGSGVQGVRGKLCGDARLLGRAGRLGRGSMWCVGGAGPGCCRAARLDPAPPRPALSRPAPLRAHKDERARTLRNIRCARASHALPDPPTQRSSAAGASSYVAWREGCQPGTHQQLFYLKINLNWVRSPPWRPCRTPRSRGR